MTAAGDTAGGEGGRKAAGMTARSGSLHRIVRRIGRSVAEPCQEGSSSSMRSPTCFLSSFGSSKWPNSRSWYKRYLILRRGSLETRLSNSTSSLRCDTNSARIRASSSKTVFANLKANSGSFFFIEFCLGSREASGHVEHGVAPAPRSMASGTLMRSGTVSGRAPSKLFRVVIHRSARKAPNEKEVSYGGSTAGDVLRTAHDGLEPLARPIC
jgi:hypothetical protein